MAELADLVKNSRSRITHTIARMERAGLVTRTACPSDGRGVLALLTDAGFTKLERASVDHLESVRSGLIDIVDADDLMAIGRAFETIIDTLETGSPDPILPPHLRHSTSQQLQPVT